MRRKTTVLLTSYILAGFLALGGAVYVQYLRAQAYLLQTENAYQRAFSTLVADVGELDTSLQKCLYTTTPSMMSSACAEVYGKAQAARYALGELPVSSAEHENTSGFIAKVGDYALVLAGRSAEDGQDDTQLRDNLKKLSETATVLADNLRQLMNDMSQTGVYPGRAREIGATIAKIGDEATSTALKSSFTAMEEAFPETPTLIYDGPFSAHITERKPQLLEGLAQVTKDEARKKAADFFGIGEKDVKDAGEREGNLPVYMFYANADGGTLSFEVTKQGGVVSDVFNSRLVETGAIDRQDAVKIAERFLEKKGYGGLKRSYEYKDDNTVTVNFAHTEGGVICYPDLIKVSVALDNGRVTGFEAQGYIMNHHSRNIPKPAIGAEAAREKVSSGLKVTDANLAVIPTGGLNEVFCHEFICENDDGSRYIVYINAETGAEENILILLESDNGTLTI